MPRALIEYTTNDAEKMYKALKIEAGREIPRTKIDVRIDGKTLMIAIEATDSHALRAAINSYMRWLSLGEEIMKVIGNG